jgi:hypothetical protein
MQVKEVREEEDRTSRRRRQNPSPTQPAHPPSSSSSSSSKPDANSMQTPSGSRRQTDFHATSSSTTALSPFPTTELPFSPPHPYVSTLALLIVQNALLSWFKLLCYLHNFIQKLLAINYEMSKKKKKKKNP